MSAQPRNCFAIQNSSSPDQMFKLHFKRAFVIIVCVLFTFYCLQIYFVIFLHFGRSASMSSMIFMEFESFELIYFQHALPAAIVTELVLFFPFHRYVFSLKIHKSQRASVGKYFHTFGSV